MGSGESEQDGLFTRNLTGPLIDNMPDSPTCPVKGKGNLGRAWGSGRGSLGLQALCLLVPTDLVCDQGGLISHHSEGLSFRFLPPQTPSLFPPSALS